MTSPAGVACVAIRPGAATALSSPVGIERGSAMAFGVSYRRSSDRDEDDDARDRNGLSDSCDSGGDERDPDRQHEDQMARAEPVAYEAGSVGDRERERREEDDDARERSEGRSTRPRREARRRRRERRRTRTPTPYPPAAPPSACMPELAADEPPSRSCPTSGA